MRAALVLALALAAGCNDPDQFSLHITWSHELGRQVCPTTDSDEFSCRAIPMSCDAKVRIRIVDDADDTIVYYSDCLDLAAGPDLCGLANLQLPSNLHIPNGMVRIQLQVWSVDALRDPDQPGATPTCPVAPGFDQRGLPLLDEPTPAVGGEVYFPVGDATVATLELGCPDYDQLDTEVCRNRTISIDADMLRPVAGGGVSLNEAADLDVRFGAPVHGDDGLWRLPIGSLTALGLVIDNGEARWRGTVPGPIDGLHCLHALQSVAQATAVATCEISAVPPSAALHITGNYVERSQIDKLTALADAVTGGIGFPLEGLVLGVVLDAGNNPAAGAVVTPSEGTVLYPNGGLDGFVTGATDEKGLFLSLDTPLATTWHAVGADGSLDTGRARGGLIADHLTVVVVKLNPPPATSTRASAP